MNDHQTREEAFELLQIFEQLGGTGFGERDHGTLYSTGAYGRSQVDIKDGWPMRAQGTLDLIDVTGPARQPSNIGAYRLKFPADNAPANTPGNTLMGTLESLEGAALDVTGTIKLAADRSYQLDTMVAVRGNAPQGFAEGMQYLGPPDAQGRRPFSVSGTM